MVKTHRAILGAGLLAIAALFAAGEVLSRPALRRVGVAPIELHADTVELSPAPGRSVKGWFSRGDAGKGAVLLLHGVRADRRQMLDRSLALRADGYSVLLIDLPAHGESTGTRITFGLREAEGVRAALAYLAQQLPGERIGVIGVSLGAASFVLSKSSASTSAVVLESMYPTIAEAVEDRLAVWLGKAGKAVAPALLWQLPLRLDISTDQLRPITEVPQIKAPLLLASGALDEHTTVAETKRIFATAGEPKELWVVDGAAHVDLYAHAPFEYRAKVFRFLAKHLRNEA